MIKTIKEKTIIGDEQSGFVMDSFGAKVLAFYQAGKNILFYDEEDISHSGIPLCFPSFGPLVNGEFLRGTQKYAMKQHGFARDQEFVLVEQSEKSLTYELKANGETKERFPFDFVFRVKTSIEQNALIQEYAFTNLSNEKLPLSPGVHPYFAVQNPKEISFTSDATLVNDLNDDYVSKALVEAKEFNLLSEPSYQVSGAPNAHISNHRASSSILSYDNKKVELCFDAEKFKYFTVWRSSEDDQFICFEPANKQNALNDDPQWLAHQETWETMVRISV